MFSAAVYFNWNAHPVFGTTYLLICFPTRCVTSRRYVALMDRRMYERTNVRTGGRTRARACRKRERRAAHGETRVLPSRCTPVALISSADSGGNDGGGGDGDGGGGGGDGGGGGGEIYVRFVIDEPARKGVDERGGHIPHPLEGTVRCVTVCGTGGGGSGGFIDKRSLRTPAAEGSQNYSVFSHSRIYL